MSKAPKFKKVDRLVRMGGNVLSVEAQEDEFNLQVDGRYILSEYVFAAARAKKTLDRFEKDLKSLEDALSVARQWLDFQRDKIAAEEPKKPAAKKPAI